MNDLGERLDLKRIIGTGIYQNAKAWWRRSITNAHTLWKQFSENNYFYL